MDTPRPHLMRRGRLPAVSLSPPPGWTTFKERSGRTSPTRDTPSIIMSPGQHNRPEHQGKAGRHAPPPRATARVTHTQHEEGHPHTPHPTLTFH
jgi:hypothetical protein